MTVFAHRGLSPTLISQLDDFLDKADFPSLYKSYDWENDNHRVGFPDIYCLELQLSTHAKSEGVTHDDIKDVACWGLNHRNLSRIKCHAHPPLERSLLYSQTGDPVLTLGDDPLKPVIKLRCNTEQVGPTYLSKVLRFALPEQFGAIDTQVVRIFGEGDTDSKRYNWINLKVNNPGNWGINAGQSAWPSEYGTWINILRYLARKLPKDCPHPRNFVDSGLRTKGVWTCADVEMALFAYASAALKRKAQPARRP